MIVDILILAAIITVVGVSYWVQIRERNTEDRYKVYNKKGQKWTP